MLVHYIDACYSRPILLRHIQTVISSVKPDIEYLPLPKIGLGHEFEYFLEFAERCPIVRFVLAELAAKHPVEIDLHPPWSMFPEKRASHIGAHTCDEPFTRIGHPDTASHHTL